MVLRTDSPYATVRNIALALLLGFVFLGIIQGLFAGDIGGIIRRVAADLPAAILGMIATTVIVDKLLQLTDALSAAVLTHSGDQAVHFLSGSGVTVTSANQGPLHAAETRPSSVVGRREKARPGAPRNRRRRRRA